MGHTKRRNVRQAPQMRSRITRSKGKPILSNPEENSQLLNAQLRGLGLYAAHTIGDGNCLFRALSDQLYGTPAHHLKLRQDICDWIEEHKDRYAPFVEDGRGLDHHLACMRQQATYGGHLELSAFAHVTRRNVKVIQPGLVYVIEWDAGGDPGESQTEDVATDRDRRRSKRNKCREADKTASEDAELETAVGTAYVAYHDWEHFSSIRNLRGPHAGFPNVEESHVSDNEELPSPPPKKPTSKAKGKVNPSKTPRIRSSATTIIASAPDQAPPLTPAEIPLPRSTSPSPPPSSTPSSQSSAFASLQPLEPHACHSPKRTFDESSASSHSERSRGATKRAKSRATSSTRTVDAQSTPLALSKVVSADVDDPDTPDLSASSSSADSLSSLSSVPSPAGTPPPPDPPAPKPLTHRQRKSLGLPKPRAALVGRAGPRTRSAGKIVIPGGRFKTNKAAATAADGSEDDADAEWRKNGTGRLDVRGFRELKI